MDEQSYKLDKMVDSLVELASNEVEKAKSRGYFSKDLAEACCYVAKMANNMQEGSGGYGNYGRGANYRLWK